MRYVFWKTSLPRSLPLISALYLQIPSELQTQLHATHTRYAQLMSHNIHAKNQILCPLLQPSGKPKMGSEKICAKGASHKALPRCWARFKCRQLHYQCPAISVCQRSEWTLDGLSARRFPMESRPKHLICYRFQFEWRSWRTREVPRKVIRIRMLAAVFSAN